MMTFQSPVAALAGLPLAAGGLQLGGGLGPLTLLAGGDGGGTAGPFIIRRATPRMRPFDMEDRIRFVLSQLPPDDPHARFLQEMLRRLPRRHDGSVDVSSAPVGTMPRPRFDGTVVAASPGCPTMRL
jgi:hypothetical protein